MKLISIDLFSGVGGLTEGMHKAGFKTAIAFEIDKVASHAYKLNHKRTKVITKDIRDATIKEVKNALRGKPIHLLAGCPPCQGFSAIRRLNRPQAVEDSRNALIMEYARFVNELRPYTFMMENVPGIIKYQLFLDTVNEFRKNDYWVDWKIVNVKDYGVPQNRKRLVLVGSRLGKIAVEPAPNKRVTVRDAIGKLPLPQSSDDCLHKIFPVHTEEILERIKNTPKNGGSRKDLPEKYILDCHKRVGVGFNDVYGRLKWDDYSSTITGGCLNPSKGRFLHPEQDRCISAREAALLQSFRDDYTFPTTIAKDKIALLIGNALPPEFSYYQSKGIKRHLLKYLG